MSPRTDSDTVLPPGQAQREAERTDSTNEEEDEERTMWFPSLTSWYQNLNKTNAAAVLVLCFVNLINYMDRSTVAGMMDDIKRDPFFNVTNDKDLGLLQTAFVICYMLFAPLFGYMGDRFSRKWIMIFGLSLWALATFVGSFMKNFWAFLFFRALVGIGEASYSTIAPAIISDLFTKDSRSRVLALFYFAIPVGTGLGYIIGSEVAVHTSDWRWGLRVTPFIGLFAILLIVFFMIDPPRGLAEGAQLNPTTSPIGDLKSLAKNKSFVLSNMGFTCVAFTAGCLLWWGPEFAFLGAKAACGNKAGCENITQADISYKFGIVMAFAGLMGVPMGSYIAQMIRHKVPNADPLVCGATLLLSVPVLFFGFFSARYSLHWCYGLTFLAGLLLNSNWSIVSDITLYIVIPTRRSIASATQILISHMFGDAISPYLIGVIADWIRPGLSPFHPLTPGEGGNSTILFAKHPEDHTPQYYDTEFRCLQYALFTCCFFQLAGSLAFLAMSWYVLDDKKRADLAIAEANEESDTAPIVVPVEGQDSD